MKQKAQQGFWWSLFRTGEHAPLGLHPCSWQSRPRPKAALGKLKYTAFFVFNPPPPLNHLIWTICSYFSFTHVRKIILRFWFLHYRPLSIWSIVPAEVVGVRTQSTEYESDSSLIFLETVLIKPGTCCASLVESFCVTVTFWSFVIHIGLKCTKTYNYASY